MISYISKMDDWQRIPMEKVFKPGYTINNFMIIRANEMSQKILKKEMAMELLEGLKDIINEEDYPALVRMIDKADIEKLNIINRILSKLYFHGKISCEMIEDEIKKEKEIEKFLL